MVGGDIAMDTLDMLICEEGKSDITGQAFIRLNKGEVDGKEVVMALLVLGLSKDTEIKRISAKGKKDLLLTVLGKETESGLVLYISKQIDGESQERIEVEGVRGLRADQILCLPIWKI